MDPTALVTFLFKAPPECRTVELLGSWDNFQHGYRMYRDRRRGHDFWSGCFRFKDIVFDGDKPDWSRPRCGGLKQGGTYWYFYRLNDDVEAFDDARNYTQGCPLLPGQTVNVIDVPVEVEDLPSRPRSASIDVAGTLAILDRNHTLDPADKWAALEPPPISKVHQRCISDMALSGRLETKPVSFRDTQPSTSSSRFVEGPQPGLTVPRPASPTDTYSFRSRGAWSSGPPSRCDASVFDAYSDEEHHAESTSLSAFPMPRSRRSRERPSTRAGGSPRQAFDFGADRRRSVRSGDDDLDGSSFIYEPTDSPPLSSYGSVDWRFTVTPAQIEESTQRPGSKGRSDCSDRGWRSNAVAGTTDERIEEAEEEEDFSPAFDISSPTFSADTISSNGGGLNTPFRLSAGFPPLDHSNNSEDTTTTNNVDTTSLDHITQRLRQLGSEDSAGSLPSNISTAPSASEDDEQQQQQQSRFLGHYALPLSVHHGGMMESATTLSKLSSGHASIAPQDLPPLPMQQSSGGGVTGEGEGGGSFADAIFSELGYLGSSIA